MYYTFGNEMLVQTKKNSQEIKHMIPWESQALDTWWVKASIRKAYNVFIILSKCH